MKSLERNLMLDGRLAYGPRLSPSADGGMTIGSRAYRRVEADEARGRATKWTGLIGEYGWDHNMLYILETDGKLHALIEWFYLYPLEEVAPDRLRVPPVRTVPRREARFTAPAGRPGHGRGSSRA